MARSRRFPRPRSRSCCSRTSTRRARGVPRRGLPGRDRQGRAARRPSSSSAIARRPRPRASVARRRSRRRVLDAGRRLLARRLRSASAPTRSSSRDANHRGVPVFNAPFSNTRCVAELILAEIVMLSRQLGDRSREVHEGTWHKVAAAATRSAARRSASSATATSARRSACSPRRSACASCSSTSSAKLPMGNNRAMPDARRRCSRGRLRHAARARDAADPEHDRRRRARADEAGRVPAQRQPRHGRRDRRARRGAQARPPRRRGGRRLSRGARGQQRRLRVAAARPAQRDPHAAHRRLDRGGAGGDRPRGRRPR